MPAIGKVTLDIKDYETMLQRLRQKTEAESRKSADAVVKEAERAKKETQQKAKQAAESIGKAGSAVSAVGSEIGGAFGKAGQVVGALVSGPLAATLAAIGVIASAAKELYNQLTLSNEELEKIAGFSAHSIETDLNRDMKQQTVDAGYMDQLKNMASQETLSNGQKKEAARLIQLLSSRYGELGISIDQTSGKITGLDAAQEKMLRKNYGDLQSKRYNQIEELKKMVDAQSKEAIKESGGGNSFNPFVRWKDWSGTGKNIQKQFTGSELDNQIRFSSKMVQNSTTEAEIEKWTKVYQTLVKIRDIRDKIQKSREAFDSFVKPGDEGVKQDTSSKNFEAYMESQKAELEYRKLILQNRISEAEQMKILNDLKAQGVTIDEKTVEAAKNLVKERKKVASAEGEKKKKEDSKKFYESTTQNLDGQIQVQTLLLQGKTEEAEKLKLILSLKQKGLAVDQQQVDAIMQQKKTLGSLNLTADLKKKGETLYDRALRAAGRGDEADRRAALKDAREKKGSDLTKEEEEKVLKYTELSKGIEKPDLADLTIQTNALTARGGFAGGASAPQSAAEKINDQVKTMSKALDSIKTFLEGLA